MPVNNTPFESKYGFKGTNFQVDEFGNITANSIVTTVVDASAVVDFTVSESNNEFAFEEFPGTNPSITLARSRSYLFSLDVPNLTFNIYDEDQTTLYSTGLSHSDTGTGASAQGQVDGTLRLTVSNSAPNTLYYGNSNGTILGTINIVDQEGLFSSVDINSTTPATSSQTGALTVAGGVGISGDLYVGGSLNIDGIGITSISSPTNLELEAANEINLKVDGNLIGIVKSTGSTVPVVDTTINNTVIGNTVPATATFSSATINSLPVNSTDVSNKQYVDLTSVALSIALGS